MSPVVLGALAACAASALYNLGVALQAADARRPRGMPCVRPSSCTSSGGRAGSPAPPSGSRMAAPGRRAPARPADRRPARARLRARPAPRHRSAEPPRARHAARCHRRSSRSSQGRVPRRCRPAAAAIMPGVGPPSPRAGASPPWPSPHTSAGGAAWAATPPPSPPGPRSPGAGSRRSSSPMRSAAITGPPPGLDAGTVPQRGARAPQRDDGAARASRRPGRPGRLVVQVVIPVPGRAPAHGRSWDGRPARASRHPGSGSTSSSAARRRSPPRGRCARRSGRSQQRRERDVRRPWARERADRGGVRAVGVDRSRRTCRRRLRRRRRRGPCSCGLPPARRRASGRAGTGRARARNAGTR